MKRKVLLSVVLEWDDAISKGPPLMRDGWSTLLNERLREPAIQVGSLSCMPVAVGKPDPDPAYSRTQLMGLS